MSKGFAQNYLGFLLAKASHITSNEFHLRLKQYQIPISSWRILASCWDDKRTVGELVEMVLLNQPTVSKSLDRLANDQLIERRKDDDNRRLVYVALTEKGRKLMEELIPLANTHEQQTFAHLSDAEKQQLTELLQKTISRV
ncbi:MarR family winged helix-turn-helix transcriptional regulator [Pseudoteredinibacter isoporae]|uniref:DNA-binding MarR family transcriptional regulator n=1 Tax=Pseudoteredinibacter isoporae TaxID=570281 RepID=A0A7X0JUE0_9GAMM|nr:MarR family transcriptional regulator [Pseudoteredinibacter isoporae]MBB6522014.1 DNA-binding MarR family transcriptional regulator [Pseudoteredinibacter isoporae]NHO87550.1 MarR family transcriptional regulator [Pseudoteredinibacter isoporae]NIB24119.1 MarR family transcriptional regulator [Pseudoteredinibacter isoporae]